MGGEHNTVDGKLDLIRQLLIKIDDKTERFQTTNMKLHSVNNSVLNINW